MRTTLTAMAVATLLAAGGPVSAEALDGAETYDLLFKPGTLDEVPGDKALTYNREVENRLKPEAAERDTGEIALAVDAGTPPVALLRFRQGDRHRGMGKFPASVGNPMIMVFYESVIRDMAESAGGSPFYIRNRVKDALVQDAESVPGEAVLDGETVRTQTVELTPFASDPNRDRMQGWGDLVLSVTMSEAVPGWYLSLVAESVDDAGTPVYRSAITFDGLEEVTP